MKQNIKQYFQFSRRQRNGIFVLLFILTALIIASATVPFWANTDSEQAQQQFEQNIQELKQLTNSKTPPPTPLKPFNPNTYSLDSLIACGVPQKLALQIINYRQKVKPFATKADFAKLYNLTDSAYNVYLPFLVLQDGETSKSEKPTSHRLVEINTADSLQLLAVRGIGPYFAHKILQYRNQLGGYFSLSQLGEAFIIPVASLAEKQQRMDEIKAQLTVNISRIKKININTANQQQLSAHPYISYKQASAILKYITRYGKIKSLDDLTVLGIITTRDATLLKHYISF
ncbi:MAG: helix-hairpin-helix domain-containing protein [Bacteroidota bacterium]